MHYILFMTSRKDFFRMLRNYHEVLAEADPVQWEGASRIRFSVRLKFFVTLWILWGYFNTRRLCVLIT